jgi:RNA polymerase sigma factor (TIGR02999 family)
MQVQEEFSDDTQTSEVLFAELIGAAEHGDNKAVGSLFDALYEELHRLAKRELARLGVPGSLGTTTLLHEAYLSMAHRDAGAFPDKARFMRYAARAMRGLVVDHVRSQRAHKRGGEFHITSLGTENHGGPVNDREIARISDALDELAQIDPDLAHLVDLKYFCGFSFDEIAAMQNISKRTVQRQWEKARIYLHDSLKASRTAGPLSPKRDAS